MKTVEREANIFLTGSQNLLLIRSVTESLAGRAAILKLLPLSCREAAGDPNCALPGGSRMRKICPAFRISNSGSVSCGGLPELTAEGDRISRFGMPVMSRPILNGT